MRNLGLLRPHRLLPAGASPPVCLSYAGWLSHCPAGCHIARCCVPLPRITFRRTGAARVDPQPLLFVRASWLLLLISSHPLRLSTGRCLMTGCVVGVTDVQA